jgi:hypothetical protein
MSNFTTPADAGAGFRTRLTIFNADVHVSFHVARDGSGLGKMVVMPLNRVGGTVYYCNLRQQNHYANEVNYRLLNDEGLSSASYEGIVAWLDTHEALVKERA